MVLIHHLKEDVITTVRKLILSDYLLDDYMAKFNEEINRGLDKDTCDDAAVKSIVTHMNKLPTGEEEGEFLGLEFSSPEIKIMLVKMEDKSSTVTQKQYTIPQRYMTAKSQKIFDFIAKSMVDFLSGLKLKVSRIGLGVTFGFPIEQTSLQDCKLLRWSKGFKCDDLIGKNIFLKLKTSFRKFPELRKIFIIGILNDSVSAVLANAWNNPTCKLGVVVGPGVSCCYVEKVSKITKYDAETYAVREMFINLESAALGEDQSLDPFSSEFDATVDENSDDPGKNINDKLTSSDYFGEIARYALLKCLENNVILEGKIPKELEEKNAITLDLMKQIESDPEDDHTNCRNALADLGFEDASDEDCVQVQFICRCVYRRSANLVAAQVATLINRINEPMVTIAVDGDLIRNYPNYSWYLEKKIKQLKKEDCNFQIELVDENGVGPVIVAAVFGEEIMNRDEKFRRLPGFPMDKCHFGKIGKCLNPDCRMAAPCDTSNVNPNMQSLTTTSQDLIMAECLPKQSCGPCPGEEKKKKNCGAAGGGNSCKGYRDIN